VKVVIKAAYVRDTRRMRRSPRRAVDRMGAVPRGPVVNGEQQLRKAAAPPAGAARFRTGPLLPALAAAANNDRLPGT